MKKLRDLGWHVETVHEHGIAGEKKDHRVVAWGREHGLVVLSMDKFQNAQDANEVLNEIRLNGGKLIQIWGGPGQPLEQALGRLLIHHHVWFPLIQEDGWLQLKDGRPAISGQRLQKGQSGGYIWRPRSKLVTGAVRPAGDPHFFEYLAARRQDAPKPKRKARKPSVPEHQGGFLLPDVEVKED